MTSSVLAPVPGSVTGLLERVAATGVVPASALAAAPGRVQRRRTAGSRLPAGARVVTRGTRYGNPETAADPRVAVAAYAAHLLATPSLVDAVLRELPGLMLACWCPVEAPCHADVLAAVANAFLPVAATQVIAGNLRCRACPSAAAWLIQGHLNGRASQWVRAWCTSCAVGLAGDPDALAALAYRERSL
ncbi:DUF4326 domain-containing protein [Natronoglycomyces albus]|uniref:DUF4326 domain-containing protein n=1 Tax=Natronoglycomyces albus TaxID=2811108 RepID=A0A895XY71_9ACTN|nr:DUF4326 domain-containing protein [Natronoglycomyces albus]QSB07140.1 DUF4326 domain-containing protein [Natronoglycomyces albus]